MYEAGETVVGWEKPAEVELVSRARAFVSASRRRRMRTLVDLLAAVDLGDLLLDELVALLADVDNLLARDAKLGDGGQDLFGDLAGGLVLGQGIRVVEGVVYSFRSATVRPFE